MKRVSLFVIIAVAALFLTASAQATCPAPPTGPYFIGYYNWYDYTADISCWSTSGNVSSSTLSCYSTPANAYGNGWTNTMTYTFTASTSNAHWEVGTNVDFDDPNDSWWNQVEMNVTVVHNGTPSYTNIFVHNGTMGDLSCAREWGTFSAQNGDTITVEIRSTKWYSNTVIKTSAADIYNISP